MLSRTNGQMGRINASTFLDTGMLPNQPWPILQERSQSFLKGPVPGPKLIDNRKLLSKKETSTSSSSKKKFKSVSGTGTRITQSCNLSFDFRSMLTCPEIHSQ